VTDDYFGYLDDDDDINQNLPAPLLDLGIGRIPARTILQARQAVDKIIQYHGKASLGPWRNDITLVADDEDFNIHLNDAEYHASLIAKESPVWNIKKIYLDAFKQESGTGGSRYPEVNATISRVINEGTLIWNYSGHGSSSRLAQEAILDKEMLGSWENATRLPLLITATCDFAPFDDPFQFSIGEDLFVGRSNGAIALMTTTRLVFASSNRIINNHFFKYLLKRDNASKYPRLGTALMDSKNFTVVNSGDYINARKFTMLGDPAMKLAMPEYSVRSTAINGRLIAKGSDTLRSLNRYTIEGEVLSPTGLLASDFNGEVYPAVFDKPTVLKPWGTIRKAGLSASIPSKTFCTRGRSGQQMGNSVLLLSSPKTSISSLGRQGLVIMQTTEPMMHRGLMKTLLWVVWAIRFPTTMRVLPSRGI
jgi:hypothetical protein